MKPFNLKEHLEHPEWKVVTREGKDARIICTDVKSEKYQVVALVTKKGGQEILATFDTSGKYRSGYNSHLDIFFAPEKHEGWVNVFKGDSGNTCVGDSRIFKSEEDAKKAALTWKTYIGTAKIEWEE